jgi:hypothetical protein
MNSRRRIVAPDASGKNIVPIHLGGQEGAMSALGQKQTPALQKTDVRPAPNSDRKSRLARNAMSALPLKADMCGATSDVRYGPKADISQTERPPRGGLS